MGAGASSSRIQQLQRQIAAEAAQRRHKEDELLLNDPETVSVLKEQVQECLKHVRSLNEKLASGKYAPDSPELKEGVAALREVLSRPAPKKAAALAADAVGPTTVPAAEAAVPVAAESAPAPAEVKHAEPVSAPVEAKTATATEKPTAVPAGEEPTAEK